jgi:hypothetical protein
VGLLAHRVEAILGVLHGGLDKAASHVVQLWPHLHIAHGIYLSLTARQLAADPDYFHG